MSLLAPPRSRTAAVDGFSRYSRYWVYVGFRVYVRFRV